MALRPLCLTIIAFAIICTALALGQSAFPDGNNPPAATTPTTQSSPATNLTIDPGVTEETVTAAIRKGVQFLLNNKSKQGDNWEPHAAGNEILNNRHYKWGVSCLVLYALLHVGHSLDDPRLKPRSEELANAVKFVTNMDPECIYGASLQTSVLCLLPPRPEVAKLLEKRRDQLIKATRLDGGHSYALDVTRHIFGDFSDSSNSQYALLALWALDDAGYQILPAYWPAAEKFWRTRIKPDGGFPYLVEKDNSSLSMTCAGVASLLITTEHTSNTGTGLNPKPDPQLDNAIAYISKNFDPENIDGYTLYGVERVGLASGRKTFNGVDWFNRGAAMLLKKQRPDGSWILKEKDDFENAKVSTAFALLFLARGRNPVVFNKLEYPTETGGQGGWNARPRDAMNLVHWMARQSERPINWQIVSIDSEPESWREAPVLLITGSKDPNFSGEQIAKMRQFVREGGLIFSTADGASKDFTNAMRKYAEAMADDKFSWRELPTDHEVYSVYQKIDGPQLPLMGLSNGAREYWIHSPTDLGATWQLKTHASAGEKSRNQLTKERPWAIAANIYFYANGKGSFRSKLQTAAVALTAERPKRSIQIGRLKYDGNWDPEPGSFERLSRVALNRWHTELAFTPAGFDKLADFPILYFTGVDKPDLKEDQIAALKDYLNRGGMLIADAANSSAAFNTWFQEFIATHFPNDSWQPQDEKTSILFKAKTSADMVDIKDLSLRFSTQVANQTPEGESPAKNPKLYTLVSRVKPRVKIFYSPHDMTLAYLGTTTASFTGYTPESAEALARNIFLYANAVTEANPIQGKSSLPKPPKPATAPATAPK